MLVGIGTDIIETDRVFSALSKKGFIKKCFTDNEDISTPQSAAGLFAAKEAVAKALGTGFSGFFPREIEILHNELGMPVIRLTGKAAKLAESLVINISISHCRNYAVAFATLETNHKIEHENILPKRQKRCNKGDFGTVSVFGGSKSMTGAALLCAKAAYRIGAGIVRVFTVEKAADVIRFCLPEALTHELPEKNGFISGIDELPEIKVAAIGCGIGNNKITEFFIEQLFEKLNSNKCKIIVDADALNIISCNKDILKNYKGEKIITPHPGEASRLLDIPIKEILDNTVYYAKVLSEKFDSVVCLKDSNTVVYCPDGNFTINESGSPALAKAGTGDVLAGTISGLVAQGLPCYDAAKTGVFLHGKAGEKAAELFGERAVLATDVVDLLGSCY